MVQVGSLLAKPYENHLNSLSLGSSASRIQVSQLEQQQFCFRGNPAISRGTIWILSPWQGAAQATRCLCFAGKRCIVIIPSLGTGWWPGRWLKGRRPTLANVRPLLKNRKALANGSSLTDTSLPSSEHGGLLRLASWGTLPRAWTPCREFQRTQSHLFGMKRHCCLWQGTGITRSLPFFRTAS